jgi:LPXTG-motif cell wall-anchored protein
MNKSPRIAATVLGSVLVVGGLTFGGVIAPAFAHTPAVQDTCESLTITFTNYTLIHAQPAHNGLPAVEGNDTPNSVEITIDDELLKEVDFGKAFTETIPLDGSVTHTYRVVLDAHDEGYDETFSGDTEQCVGSETPPPTEPPTTTPPTTTPPTTTPPTEPPVTPPTTPPVTPPTEPPVTPPTPPTTPPVTPPTTTPVTPPTEPPVTPPTESNPPTVSNPPTESNPPTGATPSEVRATPLAISPATPSAVVVPLTSTTTTPPTTPTAAPTKATKASADELASTGVSDWTSIVLASGFIAVLLGAGLLIARRTRRA